jgi:NAD-dependent deacetylase sirtuin 2
MGAPQVDPHADSCRHVCSDRLWIFACFSMQYQLDRKLVAGASALPKEPETMDPASEDDEDEDRDEDENDQTGDEAEDGVDFEGDDDAFMQMVAEAAASHGIPLQWVLSHMHGEAVEDDGPVDYVFDSLPKSLSEVAAFIKSDKCQRILVLAGAGMSVASGIPDFRSADGLYATLNVNRLTCTSEGQRELIREDPSVALDQHLFLDNPLPCLESQREFILGTHARQWKTTLAHRFVELLHHKTGKLVRLYTQNIDGLEDQCANLPEEKVIAVHGSMDRAECARCETPDDFGRFCRKVREQIKDLTLQDEAAPDTSTPITCETCGSPSVKPAIVLFRSSLPKLFFERVPEDVKDVDLLIVVGTSLKVAPANSLVRRVPRSAMRLLVNREVVGEHLGMSFGDEAERDVFAEGDIDPVLLDLVEELGWLDDLRSLLDEGALPSSSMDLLSARLEASTASPSDEQVSSAES